MAIPELESLYNTYKTPLYRYLLHLCRDPHRAEDLLADTFLRALRCLPAYRGEGSVKAWLFGLARNIWLEELRRSRPALEYDDMLGLYMEDHLAEQADARRKLDRVRQLLAEKARLPRMWWPCGPGGIPTPRSQPGFPSPKTAPGSWSTAPGPG